MKKILIGVAVVIVLAIGVAFYLTLSNIDTLVKHIIETQGSQATLTKVRVKSVHIELTKGSGTIQGLTVANPPGFSQPDAFTLGEIATRIDIDSLIHQPYVIDTIAVRAPQVFMEVNKDNQINLDELKKNLQSQQHPGKTQQAAANTKNQPRLIIRQLLFTGGTINAHLVPLKNKQYTLELPPLKMENLGDTNGATPSELAHVIINRLLDRALETVKNKGINAELDKLKSQGRQKLESEKSKLQEKGGQRIQEEENKLQEKLKNMLK